MSLKSILMGATAAFILATPAMADIEIREQYARSSNAMAGAAFMIIHNSGDTDDRLLSVTSDVAVRVELHTHIEDTNGVMRMTHMEDGVDLPAGGNITMKRGDAHVMFMGLTDAFEQDDVITITFQFENAGDIIVDVPVDQDRVEGDAGHGSDG